MGWSCSELFLARLCSSTLNLDLERCFEGQFTLGMSIRANRTRKIKKLSEVGGPGSRSALGALHGIVVHLGETLRNIILTNRTLF